MASYVAILFVLLGAFFAGHKSSRSRSIGFGIWIFTNSYFIYYNWNDWPMVVYFGLLTVFFVVGLFNNMSESALEANRRLSFDANRAIDQGL